MYLSVVDGLCVVHTEVSPVLLEFVADMHLHPFVHGMQGPTWSSAQGFVGALYFFLSRNVFPEVCVLRVEDETVSPSDHYPVRLPLLTLPALTAPCNPLARARFNMGSGVFQQQLQIFVDSCVSLLSKPPAALLEGYRHFVAIMATTTQAVFGPVVAQGWPASAMVFFVVVEVRAFLALLRIPPCQEPGGPFNRLGYMDNTTWCIDSEAGLPVFADNLRG